MSIYTLQKAYLQPSKDVSFETGLLILISTINDNTVGDYMYGVNLYINITLLMKMLQSGWPWATPTLARSVVLSTMYKKLWQNSDYLCALWEFNGVEYSASIYGLVLSFML